MCRMGVGTFIYITLYQLLLVAIPLEKTSLKHIQINLNKLN